MSVNSTYPEKRFLRFKDTAAMLGVHLSTLIRWTNNGTFPAKVRLGPGRVGFAADDVNAWIADRRGIRIAS